MVLAAHAKCTQTNKCVYHRNRHNSVNGNTVIYRITIERSIKIQDCHNREEYKITSGELSIYSRICGGKTQLHMCMQFLMRPDRPKPRSCDPVWRIIYMCIRFSLPSLIWRTIAFFRSRLQIYKKKFLKSKNLECATKCSVGIASEIFVE